MIPESKAVLKASNTGTPVVLSKQQSNASQAYHDAVGRFFNEQIEHRFSDSRRGFLSRLMGKVTYPKD